MSDTIFYSLKLKDNKSPNQIFERIQKKVKPKGATAKWTVFTDGQSLIIDFGDGASETFCLNFEKKQAKGFCKVAFPMGGELFENEKKSEWKKLISILHSIKPMCLEINVDDDYSIAGEYFKSLDYNFDIRDLKPDEIDRLERLFRIGYTNYETFLLKIFADDTQRDYPKDFNEAINPDVRLIDPFPEISAIWETYILETSTLKKHCFREIYNNDKCLIDGNNYISGDPPAEIYTFCLGVGRLFSCYNFIDNTWGKGANVTKYFYDKLLPALKNADDYGKCKLAYRFMVSVYDYCKFTFVGKALINEMIDAYEK